MSIDQHINVVAKINNAGIAKQGFGTIGVLSYTALFAGRTKTFGARIADLIDFGFAADGPEVAAVERIMAQSPHPTRVKILRGTRPPTLKYTLAVGALRNLFGYGVNVAGEGVTTTSTAYASDANATNDEVMTGVAAALNAVVGKNYLASLVGVVGAKTIEVVGTAPGEWFGLEVLDTTALTIAITHVDPGIALDLAEILVADEDWYYLTTNFNSPAMVLEAAELIEATPFKAYLVDLVDSAIENTAAPGVDIAAQLKALGYKRTLYAYHRKPAECLAAGVEGRIAPLNVGKWTAAYMTITGATADSFSADQMTNLDAKLCSYYKTEAGVSLFWKGWVANLQYKFIDTTVALDFVIDLIQKRLFGVLYAAANAGSKIGFVDEDIQGKLKPAGQGALNIAKSDAHKIVARGTPGDPDDPEPTFTFPLVADVDPDERADKNLPDGAASFRLQGAVLTVGVDLTATF